MNLLFRPDRFTFSVVPRVVFIVGASKHVVKGETAGKFYHQVSNEFLILNVFFFHYFVLP